MFLPVVIRGTKIDLVPWESLSADLSDMSIPLATIGDRIREGVAANFETEGSWGGQPWRELMPKYKRWKESKVPGLPKLIGVQRTGHKGQRPQTYAASGRMRLELLSPAAVTVSHNRAIYEPASDIAGFHQTGTPRMVARPPVLFPLHELAAWDEVFVGWVNGLIERHLG